MKELKSEMNNTLGKIFYYDGICIACGEAKYVNIFGFCEECWKNRKRFEKNLKTLS